MKPLAAHVLKARVRSNGAALHTLDHQFSKSVRAKSPRRDADSTRVVGVSQGGQLFEDTAPRGGSISGRFLTGNDVQNSGTKTPRGRRETPRPARSASHWRSC